MVPAWAVIVRSVVAVTVAARVVIAVESVVARVVSTAVAPEQVEENVAAPQVVVVAQGTIVTAKSHVATEA